MHRIILLNHVSNVEYRDDYTICKPDKEPHGFWAIDNGKVIIFNRNWNRVNIPENWRLAPKTVQDAMKKQIDALFEEEILDK